MTIRTSSYERAQEPIRVYRTMEHQLVHEGRVFVSHIDLGVVGSAINNVVIQTGDAVTHLRGLKEFNESGIHILTLYENPTITTIGTQQTVINVNRVADETKLPTTKVYKDSVITTPGTSLFLSYDFAKTGSGQLSNEGVPEYILDRNSNYYIRSQHFTPSGNVALSLAWYEFSH